MSRTVNRVFLLNSPEDKGISRDMAGGLGFDRSVRNVLPPLDLLSYATALHAKGYIVEMLDAQVEELSALQIGDVIVDFIPDAVILTVSLPTLESDIAYARELKQRLHDRVQVILKTGIRFAPVLQQILEESKCAFCITGECDLTLPDMLEGNTREGTVRFDHGVYADASETLLKELDGLPILNRKFLKNDRYSYTRLGCNITTMQTSRGCPFGCGYYCPYPLVQGKKWRAMSAGRVIREVVDIVRKHDVRDILFRDATFTLNRERTMQICQGMMTNGVQVNWWCETRVDCLDEALLDTMKRAGCKGINVGIETGDIALLSDVAKTGLTPEKIVQITEHCKRIGLELHYLLMVGLPGETRDSLFETFKLVDQMQPESIGITTVTPYPGTELFRDAIQNDWLVRSEMADFGGHGFNMQIGDMDSEALKFALNHIHAVSKLAELSPEKAFVTRQKLYQEFKSWRDKQNAEVSTRSGEDS
jgi:radical SAM superfamily enzyme YgiQ (UPF0313 family)